MKIINFYLTIFSVLRYLRSFVRVEIMPANDVTAKIGSTKGLKKKASKAKCCISTQLVGVPKKPVQLLPPDVENSVRTKAPASKANGTPAIILVNNDRFCLRNVLYAYINPKHTVTNGESRMNVEKFGLRDRLVSGANTITQRIERIIRGSKSRSPFIRGASIPVSSGSIFFFFTEWFLWLFFVMITF